jgi:hypothetical protein
VASATNNNRIDDQDKPVRTKRSSIGSTGFRNVTMLNRQSAAEEIEFLKKSPAT